jgi:hypothetical protein
MRVENFDTRSAMIEETHENFLRLLVSLGGYCTVTGLTTPEREFPLISFIHLRLLRKKPF